MGAMCKLGLIDINEGSGKCGGPRLSWKLAEAGASEQPLMEIGIDQVA